MSADVRRDLGVAADALLNMAERVAVEEGRALESVVMGVAWAALERHARDERERERYERERLG